jgi:hypothetical protein
MKTKKEIEARLKKDFAKHMWPEANNSADPIWYNRYAGWVFEDAVNLVLELQNETN